MIPLDNFTAKTLSNAFHCLLKSNTYHCIMVASYLSILFSSSIGLESDCSGLSIADSTTLQD